MTPEMMEGTAILCIYMFVILLILCVGCIVSDYIFPRIPFLNRWLDSLPEYEDDEEVYAQYLEERRARRMRRARRKERRSER